MPDFSVTGEFGWRIRDVDGKTLDKGYMRNSVTYQGLNHILDTYFRQGTGPTIYCSLISETSYTGLSVSDTMSSHSGWVEATTYSASTRPTLTFPSASGGYSSSSAFSFASTSISGVVGVFLCTDNTKSGTTGVLWNTAAFDAGTRKLLPGQTLDISYFRVGMTGS